MKKYLNWRMFFMVALLVVCFGLVNESYKPEWATEATGAVRILIRVVGFIGLATVPSIFKTEEEEAE